MPSTSTPVDTSSRQRSSRCCDGSSTISASRAGASRTPASRARISALQSGMFASGDTSHRFHEGLPRFLLTLEHAPPFRRDPVVAAPPLACLLDPRPLDPGPFLEPVQQGIERVDVKRELAIGSRVDQLAQLVAVA